MMNRSCLRRALPGLRRAKNRLYLECCRTCSDVSEFINGYFWREERLAEPWLQQICGNHEPFDRFAGDESVDNLGDVRSRNVPVKKVIGFD